MADYMYDMDNSFMNFTEFFGTANMTQRFQGFLENVFQTQSILFILLFSLVLYLFSRIKNLETEVTHLDSDVQTLWKEEDESSEEDKEIIQERLSHLEEKVRNLQRNVDENYQPTSGEED